MSGSGFGGEDIETEEESRVLYGAKVETSRQAGWGLNDATPGIFTNMGVGWRY